jgi:hypothetical protein
MTTRRARRKILAAFIDELVRIVEVNPEISGAFVVLMTENGRSQAFITPGLAQDPTTAVAEITRCRNAFAAPHGVSTAALTDRMVAIAALEDGNFRGRA